MDDQEKTPTSISMTELRGKKYLSIEEEKHRRNSELVKHLVEEKRWAEAADIVLHEPGFYFKQFEKLFNEHAPRVLCEQCHYPKEVFFDWSSKEWVESSECASCDKIQSRATVEENIQGYLLKRGIPPRFLLATIEDFSLNIQQIVKKREEGLFFAGPRGVGKTHLAAAIMRYEIINSQVGRYIDERAFPAFISVPELLFKIKASFHSTSDLTPEDILHWYSTVPILILDDLGAEKPSEWVTETLFLLIDRRYGNKLPTIITSNLLLKEIASQIDDRIASRIVEMCSFLKVTGKDRRMAGKGL